jgi:DNA polymerase-3 subunit gamma/tau
MNEEQAKPAQADPGAPDITAAAGGNYRVLARKYRPQDFNALIGQEAMVRTLRNAFATGRLAHAFMLTGVRGVGKTTTARIIAKALNCVGPDGAGGPTVDPCGVCENCVAITQDRHVDVLEMDAASRTGVEDIRELIDGVRYRPVAARTKVYIIDEVHMLSRNAFNALLKTLEEPPEHVTFIFATTEIRKVPVTVLSRCQRFDLRRVPSERLAEYFSEIAVKEGAKVSPAALALIARAADGSVRDGQSLLDQAIAGKTDGADEVAEADVRAMLGLADRGRSFDLLDALFAGRAAEALEILDAEYEAGADPVILVQDLLELTHWLTRIKVTPSAADSPSAPENERVHGREMAEKLAMAVLGRTWQLLLKGLNEARMAPAPIQAVEMLLVRLAYAADLPTPTDAIKALSNDGGDRMRAASASPAPAQAGGHGGNGGGSVARGSAAPALEEPVPDAPPAPGAAAPARPDPRSFADIVALADGENERVLFGTLVNDVHLVSFAPGKIEIRLTAGAAGDTPKRLGDFLRRHTGTRWWVTVSNEVGEDTVASSRASADAQRKAEVAAHPRVKEILDAFPGATIERVRDIVPDMDGEADGGTPAPAEPPAEESETP